MTTSLLRPLSRLKIHSHDTPLDTFKLNPNILGDKNSNANSLNFFIKRDDLTGSVLTGNKVRKLEFLLGDAKRLGCDTIVTYGRKQSNWCRTSAAASIAAGFDVDLILICDDNEYNSNNCQLSMSDDNTDNSFQSNYLLNIINGANVHIVNKQLFNLHNDGYNANKLLTKLCDHLEKNYNKKCYPIMKGGSNKIGVWGYISMIQDELSFQVEELIKNGLLNGNITDIVVPTGSGGTLMGIIIGTYINKRFRNNKQPNGPKIHSMVIKKEDFEYYYKTGNKILKDINFDQIYAKTMNDLNVEFYDASGSGYVKYTSDEFKFLVELAQTSGVLLDPTYNGKGLFYFIKGVNQGNIKTQGKNVLFLHTGGMMAYFEPQIIQQLRSFVPGIDKQRKFDFVSKL